METGISGKQLTRFHLTLLQPEQERFHSVAPGDVCYDPFYRPHGPTPWGVPHEAIIPVQHVNIDNKDLLIYTPQNDYHLLLFSVLEWSSPAIRVKDEFRDCIQIKLCLNVGNSPFRTGNLKICDDVLQNVDDVSYDHFLQSYRDMLIDEERDLMEDLGNVPELQEWQSVLPRYPFYVVHPWMYNIYAHNKIPLFFYEEGKVTHTYHASLKLSDILCMQQLTESGWVETPPDFDYLEGVDKDTELEIPRMRGYFFNYPDGEIDKRRNDLKMYYEMKERGEDVRDMFNGEYHYIDMIPPPETKLLNPIKFGDSINVKLHTDTGCVAVTASLRNVQAAARNDRSNYTTNPKTPKGGWSPISKVGLDMGGNPIISLSDARRYEKGYPKGAFPSRPYYKGHIAIPLANDTTCANPEVSTVLAGTSASLQLVCGNTDIYLSTADTDSKVTVPKLKLVSKMNLLDLGSASNSSQSSAKQPEDQVKKEDVPDSLQFLPCVRQVVKRWFRIVYIAKTGKFDVATDVSELNKSVI